MDNNLLDYKGIPVYQSIDEAPIDTTYLDEQLQRNGLTEEEREAILKLKASSAAKNKKYVDEDGKIGSDLGDADEQREKNQNDEELFHTRSKRVTSSTCGVCGKRSSARISVIL